MSKKKISEAVRERLRAMRKKYHLGEYSKKAIANSYNSVSRPEYQIKTRRRKAKPRFNYMQYNEAFKYGKKRKFRAVKRRSFSMAKHRKSSRKGGLLSGGSLMTGIIKPKGMIAAAIIGVGAAAAANHVLGGERMPYQSEVIGFLTGGPIGAGANFLLKNMGNVLGGSSTAGGW